MSKKDHFEYRDEEVLALKRKITEQQQHVEDLYIRINYLEEIEQRYRQLEQEQSNVLPSSKKSEILSEIDALKNKVNELRRVNYTLRKNKENEYGEEHNRISYFDHRLRTATITQIWSKIETLGIKGITKHNLSMFTTDELILINRSHAQVITRLLLDITQNEELDLSRIGVNKLLSTYTRYNEEDKFITAHNIKNEDLINKLILFTDSALKLINMLPFYVQKELLQKFKKNKTRIWNGAFIKGYYFLSQVLEYSKHKKYILKDITFKDKQNQKA